jgi:hypothetical protein
MSITKHSLPDRLSKASRRKPSVDRNFLGLVLGVSHRKVMPTKEVGGNQIVLAMEQAHNGPGMRVK